MASLLRIRLLPLVVASLIGILMISGVRPVTAAGVVPARVGPSTSAIDGPAPGTVLAQWTMPNPFGFVNGRAVAFDGQNLWLDYAPQWNPETHIYEVSTSGSLIKTLDIGVGVGALAWDPKRGVLWGANYEIGKEGNIYTIDRNTGVATLQFTFHMPVGDNCFGSAPGYIDGLEYDAVDDTLWISDDGGHTVYHVSVTGATLSQFAVLATTGVYDCNSGIAFDGGHLWLAVANAASLSTPNPVGNIIETDLSGNLLSTLFPSDISGRLVEDMSFDASTFAPNCALWTNEATTVGTPTLIAYALPCYTGSITAKVFNDVNHDGLQTGGEPNLQGWTVSVFRGSSCSGPAIASSATDFSGSTVFRGLVPGSYSVLDSVRQSWMATTATCQSLGVAAAQDQTVRFGAANEFDVSPFHSWETSLAADPNDEGHMVLGFIDRSRDGACDWAESRVGPDGVVRSQIGGIQLPSGYSGQGDPWLRYGLDGKSLYYSCLATSQNPHNPRLVTWAVLVAMSPSGSAADFQQAHVAITTVQLSCTSGCKTSGFTIDHPGLALVRGPNGGSRVVACWNKVSASNPENLRLVQVAYSDNNGLVWSSPITRATGRVGVPVCGGGPNQIGVTWWDASANVLRLDSSTDGSSWSSTAFQPNLGVLAPVGAGSSTTYAVLSEPFALVLSTANGLRAIYQKSTGAAPAGGRSEVFYADAANSWQETPIGDSSVERFLPGAGTCADLVGMYERDSSGAIKYTGWSLVGGPHRLFRSGLVDTTEVTPSLGDVDSNYSAPRIGDYTGADCSGGTLWFAWADTRDAQSEYASGNCSPAPNCEPDVWSERVRLTQ